MEEKFSNGVYPVMLTPFTEENKVDYDALGKLIDWYIEAGVNGLFAVCQSSEMFFLTLEERVEISKFVVKYTNKRVPVISSGHTSDGLKDQVFELNEIAKTGVDAVIMITNRLAKEDEDDEVLMRNLKVIMDQLPADMPLGFYECPYPYKRLISPEILKWCTDTNRFYFIKDTSCDLKKIELKLEAIKGSSIKLFNANSSTLIESLEEGASGFSGVMANFHPKAYTWIIENYKKQRKEARELGDVLTILSLIERQVYPINAKYFQKKIGNFNTILTRSKDNELFNPTCALEMEQFLRVSNKWLV